MKLKLLAFAFVLAFAITSFGALGAGGAFANTPELEVGLLSPEGSITVVGPAEATGGAATGFTAVTGAGVEIENIDVSFNGTH